jgi:hypothetical protein
MEKKRAPRAKDLPEIAAISRKVSELRRLSRRFLDIEDHFIYISNDFDKRFLDMRRQTLAKMAQLADSIGSAEMRAFAKKCRHCADDRSRHPLRCAFSDRD